MSGEALRDLIAGAPGEAAALRSPSGSTRFDALRRAAPAPVLAALAQGRRIALQIADPMRLARAIVALDGAAEQILLVSADTSPEVAATLMVTAETDVTLSDRPATVAACPHLAWDDDTEAPAPAASLATRWVLATSGTTGTPKLVAHTLASLTRTAARTNQGGAHRWGQIYNMCRFAGAQVMLQSLIGGSTLLLAPLEAPLRAQAAFLAQEGVTALSATPTLWRKILMAPESADLRLRQITLGGEIVDDAVLAALAERFPDARIVHIYASTEAGAAFSVRDRRAGFPAAYLTDPPGGVAIQVRDGRLFIRNDAVTPSYLGSGARFAGEDGFVDTGDMVTQHGDRIVFLGRIGGMINVGGNKLYPEEVERALLAHPDVRFARVYAKKSPIVGELVAADVVAAEGKAGAELRAALIAHCRARLEGWKTPALVKFVDDFDANSGGKLARGGA